MAYLDIDNMFAAPVMTQPAVLAAEDAATPASGFSALEWSVIALARRDSLRSLRAPGRLSRAIGGLFGLGTTSRLADERLEALRRLAVQAWHRGFALPEAEVTRFMAAGFAKRQVETLLASITGMRVDA